MNQLTYRLYMRAFTHKHIIVGSFLDWDKFNGLHNYIPYVSLHIS